MKYVRIILFILFQIIGCSVYAQPQINNWFFSSQNGISFASGSPVNIPGGGISVPEGAAAVSDKNGQLLFYTDGIRVWNRQLSYMTNGFDLHGGFGSSTQAAVIVPKTADGRQYYIFTADEEAGGWGIKYSVIDMTLSSGDGSVTTKNVPLINYACEKITAVRHCNKKQYWIICHAYGSADFYSYLSSDTGVNKTPVISRTGSVVPVSFATMVGSLKASPDGKKLVAAHGDLGVELADFDNQTGIVSNAGPIYNNILVGVPYGVEFSSNSSMLYVSITYYWDPVEFKRFSGVFQYDVSLPNRTAIINSMVQLSKFASGNEMGCLQRGPDGKIYMAQYKKNYLSVINSPGIYGTGCNFVDTGFVLPYKCDYSLPNFINDYFDGRDSFSVSNGLCINTPIGFNYIINSNLSSLVWDFDDPASGTQNTSTVANTTHKFSSIGTYNVKLIKYGACGNDTLEKQITIGDLNVNLGNDIDFCERSAIVLNPQSTGSNTYLWQNGTTQPTFLASASGQYWVQVSSNSNGCVKRDSILLTLKPLPVINLGKDTVICVNQMIILDAKNTGAQYIWQDNTLQQTFTVNQSGSYWVEVTVNGCKNRDTIIISPSFKPQFSLGPDQYLCPGLPIQLAPGVVGTNYVWQDGSLSPSYEVKQPGMYYVDVSNTCGVTRDSINIITGICNVHIPSAFTPNGDGINDKFKLSSAGLITEFEMKIFNRYGQVIFFTQDKNGSWDGKFKGQNSPAGVYIYFIKYNELNSVNSKLVKGTVILLH